MAEWFVGDRRSGKTEWLIRESARLQDAGFSVVFVTAHGTDHYNRHLYQRLIDVLDPSRLIVLPLDNPFVAENLRGQELTEFVAVVDDYDLIVDTTKETILHQEIGRYVKIVAYTSTGSPSLLDEPLDHQSMRTESYLVQRSWLGRLIAKIQARRPLADATHRIDPREDEHPDSEDSSERALAV